MARSGARVRSSAKLRVLPLRIAFFTLGSRGDVEPLAVLAKGFADAGHDVRFISDESAEPLVAPLGIAAHFLPGNLRERWNALPALPTWRRLNPYTFARSLTGAYADVISSWAVEAAEVAQGSKLMVLSNASSGVGYALAQRIRAVPCEASVLPVRSSRHLPSALLPWPQLPLPGSAKRFIHEAAVRASWLGIREGVNAARRALGLEEVSWPFDRSRSSFRDALPCLYGFSPTLVPPPPDWPKNIAVTGFWHGSGSASWQPPRTLASFLGAGSPPVYVGFGSMRDQSPLQVGEIVTRSVRRLGLRAIVSMGWGAMAGVERADDFLVVDDVPHDWLFPRVAAVVCHGGAGTVGAVLRSGTPSVIVPYVADHSFWGWAMERLGVAPRMIPRRYLSVERLTAALRHAVTDQAMRERAIQVSGRVRAEHGVRRAVEVIEAWLSPPLGGATGAKRPQGVAEAKSV